MGEEGGGEGVYYWRGGVLDGGRQVSEYEGRREVYSEVMTLGYMLG